MPPVRDLYADTWVATDALGRTMPTHEEVGPPKDDQPRVVSMFYITWHTPDFGKGDGNYTLDVNRILAEHPEARLDKDHPAWAPRDHVYYHFAEPEMGYFLSQDEYVIRRDMSMLTDAGVDLLVMDVTNAVRYWEEWDIIFSVMMQMRAEGSEVPKFCFWAFNGEVITVVEELYNRIYAEERFKELWYDWHGKPLLLYNANPLFAAASHSDPHENPSYDPEIAGNPDHPLHGNPRYTQETMTDYSQEVYDFFTLRMMWFGYYEWDGKPYIGTEGNWSFGYWFTDPKVDNLPIERLVAPWKGVPEQAAVTAAQHPLSLTGKSWSRKNGQPELDEYDMPKPTYVPWLDRVVENPEDYGIYFQERWDEALAVDPQHIYVNDWNEWTAIKFNNTEGGTWPFMRRASNFRFVDQYNTEFTRGIQPMRGGYTDNYYMQLVQNVRRYKGVRPIPRLNGFAPVQIDGEFADWDTVRVEYRDALGDTAHRDHPGYGGLHYTDTSGRNDIITAKVAVDEENIYFMVETRENLTPHHDPNWMLLLIDADKNTATGWHGYDYLVNKTVPTASETTLMRYEDGEWSAQPRIAWKSGPNMLEVAIPRSELGLTGDRFTFDFKWTDNPGDLDDIITICTDGDTAPNRRFNYRCIWQQP